MNNRSFNSIIFSISIFILFFYSLGNAEIGDNSSFITAEIKNNTLEIRSLQMDYNNIISFSLNDTYLDLKSMKDKGLAQIEAFESNFEITLLLKESQLKKFRNGLLSVFLKNGTLTKVPISNESLTVEKLSAQALMPGGIYSVKSSLLPTSTGLVNQQLVAKTASYKNEGGKGWWFCGQSSLATIINYLRQEKVTEATKISQLQWIHDRLKIRQPYYLDNKENPHREADIDGLNNIIKYDKANELLSNLKKIGDDRVMAREELLRLLKSGNQYALVLTEIDSSGHYYIVYKIDYQPGTPTGGTVFYSDVLKITNGTMPFSKFLSGMRRSVFNKNTKKYEIRHSFIEISKK